MPSRAPITDEEMKQLRDRMEQWFAAKSTQTPPPAPSQTFGMRTHSARRTSPRQRYDPQAAAEARHADRMRLAELRKTVLTQQAAEATAQDVKRAARIEKDKEAALRPKDPGGSGTGVKSGAFYQTKNPEDDTGKVFPFYSTSVAEDYAAASERRERPISSMYSVTPSQYLAAYGVPFTGSDPDSMRRLLALQNGTASVIGSERGVIDQRQTDKDNADKYANMKPAEGVDPRGIRDWSDYQRRANLQIPEADVIEAKRFDDYAKVIENAQLVAGITPESIDASDREEKMKLEREGSRPEFTESPAGRMPTSKPSVNPPVSSWFTGDLTKDLEELGKGGAPVPKGSILYDEAARRLAELKARYGGR